MLRMQKETWILCSRRDGIYREQSAPAGCPAAPRGLAEGDKAEAGRLLGTHSQVLPVHRAPTAIAVSLRNLYFIGVTVEE